MRFGSRGRSKAVKESPLLSKSNVRMRILFLSRRFPPVRLGYVTEMNWRRRPWKRRTCAIAAVFVTSHNAPPLRRRLQSLTLNLGHTALIPVFLSSNVVLKWFFGGIVQVRGQHWGEREKEVEHNMSTLFLQLTQVLLNVPNFRYFEAVVKKMPRTWASFEDGWLLHKHFHRDQGILLMFRARLVWNHAQWVKVNQQSGSGIQE